MPAEIAKPEQFSIAAKVIGVYVGILLTGISFMLGSVIAPWSQVTHIRVTDYVGLLLSHYGTFPFYPLILYSIVCMIKILFSQQGSSQPFLRRLGVYTGVIWSLQYAIMLSIVTSNAYDVHDIPNADFFRFLIFAIAETLILWGQWTLLKHKFRTSGLPMKYALVLIMAVSFCICTLGFYYIFGRGNGILDIWVIHPFSPIVLPMLLGPFWSFAMYLWLSICVFRKAHHHPVQPQTRILSFFGWISAYIVAWRLSIYTGMKYYATLPKNNDCYVATAAAKGHKRLVKSSKITLYNGRIGRVNNQMRYLKCGELLLKVISPRLHRCCRGLYNTIGPVLAKLMINAFIADVAYLTLKPAEWFVRCMLKIVVPGVHRLSDCVYPVDTNNH